MYTARAAAIVDDVAVLTRLASDPEDNVAEAALTPLRRLIGADSDALFVDVLNRKTRTVLRNTVRPYQVIRTAALALDGATSTRALVTALAGALERISAEQCETSRDTRLALITRLGPTRLAGAGGDADAPPQGHRSQGGRSRRDRPRAVDGQGGRDRHAAPEVDQHTDGRRALQSRESVRSRWTAGAGSMSSWILWMRR